ncbi:MAG TPA: GNAT family N-acetyltransferase [Pyrinomonadaceae bacterium]|nr:GNAT family N-acetyltransferase [Pyrinomonadaceae bacterium]
MDGEPQVPSNITLRPVVLGDQDFLIEVYASTRAEELAIMPWTDEQRDQFIRSQFNAQQQYYAEKYPTGTHDVILSDGQRAGRIYVARLDQEIRIIDIAVIPAERNRGIGSYLIKQLLEEATGKNKITRIFVEDFNPSLSLFKRFGFNMIEQHGFHLLLQWTPPAYERT